MPFDLQAKFLRVLQERVITRLGSNEPVPLDVRFIATSKVDLAAEVAAGRFRASSSSSCAKRPLAICVAMSMCQRN
jgi:DNA-binding NtrC family response regulator